MTSECGAEYSRLFHGWSNDIIYDITVEQNIPDYSMGGVMTSFMTSVWSRTFQNFPWNILELMTSS